MDARQAFKFGFISQCIAQGHDTPEKIAALLEKRAGLFSSLLGGTLGTAKDVASTGANWLIPAALVAPPVLGAVGGTVLGKMQDVDDTDVNEAKNQELIDEYRRQAARIRRESLLRQHQQQRASSGKVFL